MTKPMNCSEAIQLLDAYVDQELFLKDSLEVEKHVKICRSCESKFANMLAMQNTFKHCKKYKPALSLQDKIQANLELRSKKFPIPYVDEWIKYGAPSFAVGVLLTGILSFNALFSTDDGLYTEEIVASHIRSMMASHITDVSTADKHQLKPWFNKVLDFSPSIEDLASRGYPLIGARLDYINQRQVISIVYQIRNHYINVFIWPIKDDSNDTQLQTNIRGYELHRWSSNRLSYVAVSDLSKTDLSQFVREYKLVMH